MIDSLGMLERGDGPADPVNARPGVGLTSVQPYVVSVPAGEGIARWDVPLTEPVVIEPDSELVWAVYPESAAADQRRWDATHVALDAVLDDGTLLSAHALTDQYGVLADAIAQGEAKQLWVDQWNLRRVALGALAGRSITRLLLVVRRSELSLTLFLDDVAVRPAPKAPTEPMELVDTRRGTHSSDRFSRGNNAPLVGLPHGGVFGLPMTDADRGNWPYAWHAHNREADNRPTIQAFATSHIPSPWMGDRGVFQVMPSPSADPDVSRSGRALGFAHEWEDAGPHRYRVPLEGGVGAEMVPGRFALGLRFTFPGPSGSIILDHHGRMTDVARRIEDGVLVVTGVLQDRDGEGFPPYFVHARIPGVVADRLVVDGDRLGGHVVLDTAAPVDVVVGLSSIDATQAAANVAEEDDVEAMAKRAADAWRTCLETVRVEGASPDRLTTLYSGLYRVFLYPNEYGETAGRAAPAYRSPYDVERIGAGRFTTTHGFWDTYRTAWPLLALLDPATSGELADGFVEHFRDGGWTPRWSAPGAQDCMTGTTFDTVAADLALRDVPGLDVETAYASALRNATVPAGHATVGRKGLAHGIFRGYIDTDTHEGLSWTLDNAINDWGTAQLARILAEQAATSPTGDSSAERLAAEWEYFARRALAYRHVFDTDRGFFIGRTAAGAWRAGEEFDPDEWGHDYTETNAWGTRFTAPHDGAGLRDLYGGDEAMAAAFEQFYARPETGAAELSGHYGFAIHEMTEARDVRMGMLGLSNQPAHHIPFMAMHAGRHDEAHRVVRECLTRLFVGSDLGQGYPGDEDNGEMSAWWIFASIGLYPLAPATASYVLVPPLFARTELRPRGGRPITITATGSGCYIRSVSVDGEPWEQISLPHSVLAAGPTIAFELSEEPCGWACDTRPASASVISGFTAPPRDLAVDGGPLTDDTGASVVHLAAGESVTVRLARQAPVSLYTVTTAQAGPVSWRIAYLDDAGEVTDEETCEETFRWDRQTRPFRVLRGRAIAPSSVRFSALTPIDLVQLELLEADPNNPKRN